MENLHSFGHLRNNPSRSPFDLAVKKVFSAKAGMLLPVYWRLTLPKQTFSIKRQHFTRTRPLQTSSFTRLKEYFDWYYVPMRLMNKNLPPALVEMENNPVQASSISSAKIPTKDLPYTSLKSISAILSYGCSATATSNPPLDVMGFPVVSGMMRMLDLMRYGAIFESTAIQSKVLPDYTSVKPATSILDGPNYYVYGKSVNVNLFPFLAYQKVYSDHFRFEQWENNEPWTYNIDYYTGGDLFYTLLLNPGSSGSSPSGRVQDYLKEANIFSLRYANWKKDYFTGVMPSPQLGDVATIAVDSTVLNGAVVSVRNTNNPVTAVRDGSSGTKLALYSENPPTSGSTNYLNVSPSELTAQFSVIQLRIAEALQKYKEVSQCNGQTYRDQIYAHFGARLSAALSDESQFIGGSDSPIDISEVVNTNLQLGGKPTISGKGTGSGTDSFTFTAPEHGVIICIYHVEPVLDYAVSGQNPQLLFTQTTDLPIPELDHIGMEGVPVISLINSSLWSANSDSLLSPLGYSSRYLPWKADIDTVHNVFRTSLQDWVAPMTDGLFVKSLLSVPAGSSSVFATYNFFKINPNILDSIFGIDADKTVDTDQFLVNCFFDVNTVAPLDYNGMPY